MKIWREFNSSHSSNISIVGTFENIETAQKAISVIEDFTLASWEERYPTIEDFLSKWELSLPDIRYIGLSAHDMDTGVDNDPNIEQTGTTIKISRFRSENFAGIIKLLRHTGAGNIVIDESTF